MKLREMYAFTYEGGRGSWRVKRKEKQVMNMKKELSIRQKRFADEYIISGNGAQALVKAGYSPKAAKQSANKMLNYPHIQRYIEERLEALASDKIAEQTEVLEYITSVMRGEAQSEIVMVEGTGDGHSEARHIQKRPDEKERLKAAELLGKRYGIFTDRLNVTSDMVINVGAWDEAQNENND